MCEVYRLVAVEDNDHEYERLRRCLEQYGSHSGVQLNLTRFTSAEAFLEAWRGSSDLVLMDIELPGMNGMQCAEKLRRVDTYVPLVFITNLAQYAVNGYAVDALDYIVKPIQPERLRFVMDKVLLRLRESRRSKRISIRNVSAVASVGSDEITYLEVNGHQMTIHLTNGQEKNATGSITAMYEELKEYGFERCNSCYLVNMRHIAEIREDMVCMVNGDQLLISKRKRKEFMDRFMDYLAHA